MRVAAVDLGTNTTRLLVADVDDGRVEPIVRREAITRLGESVDRRRVLLPTAIARVRAVLVDYRRETEALGAERVLAVGTSAMREAENGEAFLGEIEWSYGFATRLLTGEEEAAWALDGVAAGRKLTPGTLVVDIGGGSTELILGSGPEPDFHASLQLGVVRHSERHVHADPPRTEELEALSDDIGTTLDAELASRPGLRADRAIAVAGTPATLAAIELGLEGFDPDVVEGHDLTLASVQQSCSRLSALPLEERAAVIGVDPARAPTIVAGVVILIKAMRAFGLERVEVSERDILYGAALELAERRNGA